MNPAKSLSAIQQPKVIVALVLISAATGAAAASVTISQQDPNKLEAAQGTMTNSADLTVVDVNMTYSGLNATGVTITVNNSASTTDHTGNVSIALVNQTTPETLVAEKKSNVGLIASTNTSVKFSFTNSYRVDTFDTVDINVEQLS